MSTMLSFSDNKLSNHFLSMDELRTSCPLAFKEEPTNPNVSNKYIVATTKDVVEDLGKLGWYPVQAKQCRPKKGSSGIHSFHMIAFQNENVKITKKSEDGSETVDSYVRIILTNSHDGFNSFKFMAGLFRLVCSNGLIVATEQLANVSIRHINYDFEALRGVVAEIIKNIPNVVEQMNIMRKTKIDDVAKKEIAKAVIQIRSNSDKPEEVYVSDETIDDILTPVRNEDKTDDLWTVFNVCQEKLIKGGFIGKATDKSKFRRQRNITSIKKDIDYNVRLWNVASKFIRYSEAA